MANSAKWMPWLVLAMAILTKVLATLTLKASDGFTRFGRPLARSARTQASGSRCGFSHAARAGNSRIAPSKLTMNMKASKMPMSA